jgi:hypothetical protein
MFHLTKVNTRKKGMHFWKDRWTKKNNEQTPKNYDRFAGGKALREEDYHIGIVLKIMI